MHQGNWFALIRKFDKVQSKWTCPFYPGSLAARALNWCPLYGLDRVPAYGGSLSLKNGGADLRVSVLDRIPSYRGVR